MLIKSSSAECPDGLYTFEVLIPYLKVYTIYECNFKYLEFQELDDHYKHTKHQGNQKNEDPNNMCIYKLYKHILLYFVTYQFLNDIVYSIFSKL